MNKPLYHFFADDHHRIEELLNKAILPDGSIDMRYYNRFRTGLLRHIKMEEKILFPAAMGVDKEVMTKILPRFRLEHGALTALMVPPPTAVLIKVIKHVIDKHDFAEEEPGGLYDICEQLTEGQTDRLLEQLSNTTEVPVHPPNPAPFALEAAKRSLARANYDFDTIAGEN
ncbi:MAG: hemerythrin domain-containing protein [Chitinophagaceae bacterium]|nr:hemerythrin domain-containing protein [Chitinophagaceae bacterium]